MRFNMLNDFRAAFVRRAFIFGAVIAMLTCAVPTQAQTTPSPKPSPKPLKMVVGHLMVTIENKSATCAWVSIAHATPYTPWAWMTGKDKARFVKPNESTKFEELFPKLPALPFDYQVKVESTFMTMPDCSGVHAAPAITEVNKDIYEMMGFGRAMAELTGKSPSSFRVRIFPNR
jgi:hypothetical protein